MTTEQKREALKTGLVIVFGIVMLLSAVGPLAAWREWLLLAAGVLSIIGSAVFGVELKTPAAQIRNVKASRLERKENAVRMARFINGGKGKA